MHLLKAVWNNDYFILGAQCMNLCTFKGIGAVRLQWAHEWVTAHPLCPCLVPSATAPIPLSAGSPALTTPFPHADGAEWLGPEPIVGASGAHTNGGSGASSRYDWGCWWQQVWEVVAGLHSPSEAGSGETLRGDQGQQLLPAPADGTEHSAAGASIGWDSSTGEQRSFSNHQRLTPMTATSSPSSPPWFAAPANLLHYSTAAMFHSQLRWSVHSIATSCLVAWLFCLLVYLHISLLLYQITHSRSACLITSFFPYKSIVPSFPLTFYKSITTFSMAK